MSIAKPKVFWPLVIITGVNDGVGLIGGLAGGPFLVLLAQGTYTSAVQLAASYQMLVRAATGVADFTVTVTPTGFFKIARTLGTFDMYFAGLPAAYTNGTAVLGWGAIDAVGVTSYTGPNQHQNGWYSSVAVKDDSLNERDRSMDVMTITMNGQNKIISESELIRREWAFGYLPPEKTYIDYEGANLNQAVERWWRDGRARFRYWQDGTVEGTYGDYVFDAETIKGFGPRYDIGPKRLFPKKALYGVRFSGFGFVA